MHGRPAAVKGGEESEESVSTRTILPVGNYLSRNVNTKTCISGDMALGPIPTGNEGAAWGTNGT